jgi:hypothetical protein
MKRLLLLVVAVALVASPLFAQDALTITSALVGTPRSIVTVIFSQPVASTGPHLDAASVRLTRAPGVKVEGITRNPLRPTMLQVRLSGDVPPGPVEVCFENIRFGTAADPRTTGELCAALSGDVEAAREAALNQLIETPKASREKGIFASGFVTTASDESEGGADIALNPDFNIPNLNAFLRLKKTTADEGDPKNLEIGANYRFAMPWKAEQVQRMRDTPAGPELNRLSEERQRNILAGSIVDVAMKLESDPTNFSVTNYVGESSYQLRTMTKGFIGGVGFWRGFVMPGGIELGRSVGASTPAEVEWLARYKAGAGFTLHYDNPGAFLPVRRIELDANAVLRYLFADEARFNSETNLVDNTDDGAHSYTQVDLKLFFGQSIAGRYGFKLSFNRGRLPPVFAEVKSFEFGFLLESGDDQ